MFRPACPRLPTPLRRRAWFACFAGLMAAAWLLLAAPALRAQPVLALDDDVPVVDAWPALAMRSDADGRLTLPEVLRDASAWAPVHGPHANLGPRRDTVWLRAALRVSRGDGRWLLDLDYPPLNEVDVYLLREGRLDASWRLGAGIPFAQRPLPTRTHAAELALEPGVGYEVLLRVRTHSAMVVPLHLMKPAAHQVREARMQAVQGMLAGAALALLVYAAGHWLTLRNALFGWYALMLLGTGAFFLHLSGLMQQHLVGEMSGVLGKLSPLSVLLAMLGGSQFVAKALDTHRHNPRLHRGLHALGAASVAGFAASASGLLDYRATQVFATVLGPSLMALAVPAAWSSARRGDRNGIYMLVGWTTYAFGALTMAGLLRGVLPANVWTQHLFQAGWLVEVFAWLRVLSVHVAALHQSAERSAVEQRTLEQLAATDALTGLPNRRGLHRALVQALAQATEGRLLAVFMIDLDGFKPVNDQFGHYAGDALLVQVGQRLAAQLRASDVVARLGGDEFVVMAAGLREEADAQLLGRKLLAAFDEPFAVDGRHCRVGLTIGLAMAPGDGLDADVLLQVADAAMYAGKQAGRHCLRRGVPMAAPTEPARTERAAAEPA